MTKIRMLSAFTGILFLVVPLVTACGPAAEATATPSPTVTGATPTPQPATPTSPSPSPTATPPVAATTPSPAAPTIGGTLRVISGSNPFGLDPRTSPSIRDQSYINHIFDALFQLDEVMQLRPGLAESWTMPNNTTLVMKLRKGVKFHDGTEFNAQVAKWNFDQILDPAINAAGAGFLKDLASYQVVNDDTFQLNFKVPSALLLASLANYRIAMMSPAAVQKWGKDVGRRPVGTGAFIFQDWVSDTHIRVNRNPNYWDSPRPYLNTIYWKMILDPAVTTAIMLTGEGDWAQITSYGDIARVKASPKLKTISSAGERTLWIWLNHLRPPVDDLNFRKALDLALDREDLTQLVLKGWGEPANSLIPNVFPEYNSTLPIVKRDVAKAKELLAKSSYKGDPLVLTTWPSAATGLAESVQAQWREIGIRVEIVNAGAAYGRVLQTLDYTVGLGTTTFWSLEYLVFQYQHSKSALGRGDRYGPHSAKVDELVDRIGVTVDRGEQKKVYDELQKLMYDQVMDLYIFYPVIVTALSPRVQNYVPYTGIGQWLHEVWIKD